MPTASTIPYYVANPEEDDPGGLRDFLVNGNGSSGPGGTPKAAGTPVQATSPNGGVPIAAQATVPGPTGYTAPKAPKYSAPDDAKLLELTTKRNADAAPIDPKTVSPKWYERLGGALVAGSMAFGRQPGALEAGSAITNERSAQATAAQRAKLAQDDAAITGFNQNADRQAKEYETQLSGYKAGLEGDKATNEQSNADRTYSRETANDTFTHNNQNRTQTRDDADSLWRQKHGDAELENTKNYQRGELGVRQGELSISRQRLKDEEDTSGTGAGAKSPRGQQALQTKISEKYGDAMDKLENGDPKGANPDDVKGFKAVYRELATSKTNPDGDPWKAGEREAALQEMKQGHADRKNSIMARMNGELGNAGIKSPLIQYDAEGREVPVQGNPASAKPPVQQPQPVSPATVTPPAGVAAPAPVAPAGVAAPSTRPAPGASQQASPAAAQAPVTPWSGPIPKGNGKPLTNLSLAVAYLQKANGDKQKARQLAAQDGWK